MFQAAQALDVRIYIHPRDPAPQMAQPIAMPGFTVSWGFNVETGTHALRLIAAGVFEIQKDAVESMNAMGLSRESVKKVYQTNAERVFKL